jgi:ATP-dependent Clp protease protease subunit
MKVPHLPGGPLVCGAFEYGTRHEIGCDNMGDLNERLLSEIVDAVKDLVRKEESDRIRDVYLIGDIEKDTARAVIEKLRELANSSRKPITVYVNSAGGNVTDGLAIHDVIEHLVSMGIEVTIVVQGMAYSMGSVVLQAASPGKRVAYPHSWIMIHEPAKWAGWQSTTAAAQHLDRLKQMQSQIYRIMADRSGKPLRQIIRDTKRVDFYLDAWKAKEYGLIDKVLGASVAPSRDNETTAEEATTETSPPSELTIHGRSSS